MAIPGNYTTIRVRWPRTTDGINVAYTKDRQIIWEETELPITAKPFIEEQNKTTPFQLRKEITVLNYTDEPLPEQIVKGAGVEMLKNAPKDDSAEVAALKAQIAALQKAAGKKDKKAEAKEPELVNTDSNEIDNL